MFFEAVTQLTQKITALTEQGFAASDEETLLNGTVRRVLYAYTFNDRGDWIAIADEKPRPDRPFSRSPSGQAMP